jgi:Ser-tRNA(Ala) deacylase AlaX
LRDQAYWSGRIGEARSQLERNRAFSTALQNRIDMLWTDFVNRDNPVERSAIERDRNSALAELDRLKKEMDEQTKGIAAIEEEARRAGVPAAWLRPS